MAQRRKQKSKPDMSKKFGVGIVGTGWVAGAHIDNFKAIDGCEVVAVSSRKIARAKGKIAAHGLTSATAYDHLDDLLAHDGVDIVVICTPHTNHPEETIAAAKAGKHIVIEKPVAMTPRELSRMVQAVDKAGVTTSVCFELRWIGLFENIKALVKAGSIGQPFYGETAYFHGIGPWYPQYPWNRKKDMGGGAFLTAGCHALDGLIWLMGSEVKSVVAMGNTSKKNPLRYEYDPNVVALLEFESGAIGKCATSVECRQPYDFPVILQGDKGTVNGARVASLEWPGLGKDDWATIPTALPDSGDVGDHPYHGQLAYFVDCIRRGKRPHNDLSSCAHIHQVMFAIDKAVATGKRVVVAKTPGTSTLFA